MPTIPTWQNARHLAYRYDCPACYRPAGSPCDAPPCGARTLAALTRLEQDWRNHAAILTAARCGGAG